MTDFTLEQKILIAGIILVLFLISVIIDILFTKRVTETASIIEKSGNEEEIVLGKKHSCFYFLIKTKSNKEKKVFVSKETYDKISTNEIKITYIPGRFSSYMYFLKII